MKNIQSIPQNQETIVASNSSLSAHLTSYSNNKMGSGLVNVSKPKIVRPNTFPKGRRNTTGMNSKIEEMFVFAHLGKQYSQRENMQHLEDHNAYLTEEKKGKGRGQGFMVRSRGRRRGNLQSSPNFT